MTQAERDARELAMKDLKGRIERSTSAVTISKDFAQMLVRLLKANG